MLAIADNLDWIGSIFFGFIPGLIVFLIKKDDRNDHKLALSYPILLAAYRRIGTFDQAVQRVVGLELNDSYREGDGRQRIPTGGDDGRLADLLQ